MEGRPAVFKTVCVLRKAKAIEPPFSLRVWYHARVLKQSDLTDGRDACVPVSGSQAGKRCGSPDASGVMTMGPRGPRLRSSEQMLSRVSS